MISMSTVIKMMISMLTDHNDFYVDCYHDFYVDCYQDDDFYVDCYQDVDF